MLPRIAERVLAAGGRLLVVCGDGALAGRLDEHLWNYTPESFLPHGMADGADPEMQPVLVSPAVDAANGATNVALADGVWRDEALGFARAFLLFDDERVEAAREAWRSLAGRADLARNFWRQEAGRWVKAA